MPAATPAMLPVPIVAASAVMNAWNGDSAPPADASGVATNVRSASRKRRTWTTPRRAVRNSPDPKSSTTSHGTYNASAADWIASETEAGSI